MTAEDLMSAASGLREEGSVDDWPQSRPDDDGSSPGHTAPPVVSCDKVEYRYKNGLVAISDLSFDVPQASSVAVVGPSGCGKSTLLRMIAGLMQPSAGTVHRNFEHIEGRHDLTMVFQEDTLLPWLTVAQNVAVFYRMHPGLEKKQVVRQRVLELLSTVGLSSFADAYPRQLSGGMKRRVAFLAGVAPNPQMLLLDEPFSSVDEPTRIEIHEEVRRIVARSRTTTILVTHDLAEAISLAERVVILSGRPSHVATTYEVNVDREQDLLSLRNSAAFLHAYGELWEALSAEIRLAKAQSHASAMIGPSRRRLLPRRKGSAQ